MISEGNCFLEIDIVKNRDPAKEKEIEIEGDEEVAVVKDTVATRTHK